MLFCKSRRMSVRYRINAAALVLGAIIALMSMIADTRSTPLTWGTDANGNQVQALAWDRGDTVNVFIEPDPDPNPPDRSALLREGMLRWQGEMANRGITVNVTVGNPPTPAPSGTVPCTYEPDGTQLAGQTLGTGEGHQDGIGGCTGNANDGLTGGQIIIRDGIPAGTDSQQEYLRNLGQHELTHVLGLADDPEGMVTDHNQTSSPNTYNDTDSLEIQSLYPTLGEDPPRGDGDTNSSIDPNRYDWDFIYTGPPKGHVALITMNVAAEFIVNVIPPAGWIMLNPADPLHKSLEYSFYQDYNEDCAPGLPPWDVRYKAPLAFRPLFAGEALSAFNPVVHITLFTQNAQRGTMNAWAGGPLQVIEGPVSTSEIPALSKWGLIVAVLLLVSVAITILHRRSREDTSVP